MRVSFGKTAYVSGTDRLTLDNLANSPLSISLTGDDTVVCTRESVEEFLSCYKENMDEQSQTKLLPLKCFLVIALNEIDAVNNNEPIGDIFFTT